jgi:hypothetical protein
MDCGFIDDGYTKTGYIKAEPGLYPELRFKYRPLTREETTALYENWNQIQASDQLSRISKSLAKHLVSWDLKDPAGRIPNCKDAATYRRLSPPLFNRLTDITDQSKPSDPDPEADQPAKPEGPPEGN